MQTLEMFEALLDLARAGELEVRRAPVGGDGTVLQSSTCRVRERVFVVLCDGDPLELQIDVLASAIRVHAKQVLEAGYLPPAVRERVAGDAFE